MNIAIFASGSGTNAENIINYFETSDDNCVNLVISNNKNSFVLERVSRLGVNNMYLSNDVLSSEEVLLNILDQNKIDFIVLAGYLKLIPVFLIEAYPSKIVNIHPALLPKYGGKGMYGMKVHKAVVDNNEKETGITIHYVNQNYDEGNVISQFKCPVDVDDTYEDVAAKIHILEMNNFPTVIEQILKEQ